MFFDQRTWTPLARPNFKRTMYKVKYMLHLTLLVNIACFVSGTQHSQIPQISMTVKVVVKVCPNLVLCMSLLRKLETIDTTDFND
jgi:hypothetical protein